MPRCLLILALLLFGLSPCLAEQPTDHTSPTARKSPVEGVRFAPVPEVLYTHLPTLPHGQGLVVEDLPDDCGLARAGVRRYDILVRYADTQLRDSSDFTRLLADDRAEQRHEMVLIRAGKEMTLAVSLTAAEQPVLPKGLIKPGGPPAVSVEAQPIQGGKLQVTFTYCNGTGKLERVTCAGSLTDIEKEVRQLGDQNRMPPRVQDLVDVALKRIRVLNAPEGR